MATDHTEDEPPSLGSTILENIGSMEKISAAERNSVAENHNPARSRARRGAATVSRTLMGAPAMADCKESRLSRCYLGWALLPSSSLASGFRPLHKAEGDA